MPRGSFLFFEIGRGVRRERGAGMKQVWEVWKVYQKLALLAQNKFGQAQLGHQRWGTMGAADAGRESFVGGLKSAAEYGIICGDG